MSAPSDPDSPTPAERPLIAFDLDGVLARPPFGRNVTIQRNLALQPVAPDRVDLATARDGPRFSIVDRLLAATYYRARYVQRAIMPQAVEAIAAATVHHRVIVLTARNGRGRASTEAWLAKHGVLPSLDGVLMNSSGLPSAQFKRAALEQIGAVRHVDDDAATAALVARAGIAVDLIDWPRNRDLRYPDGVTRRADLGALIASFDAAPLQGD